MLFPLLHNVVLGCVLNTFLSGTGFHRSLSTEVYIDYSPDNLKCSVEDIEVALVQKIPNTAYVDFHEIKEALRMDQVGAVDVNPVNISRTQMDVERHAEVSRGYGIAMYLQNDNLGHTTTKNGGARLVAEAVLPIHLRYQMADMVEFKGVTFPEPLICIRCKSKLCPLEERECNAQKRRPNECKKRVGPGWYPVQGCSADLLYALVPVGDIDSVTFVHSVTSAVVWIGAFVVAGLSGYRHL